MIPPKQKAWFEKEYNELTKFDWRDAVNAISKWKRETILGRVAVKIADYYNPDSGYAYPSLSRLARDLNTTQEKVSAAISKLRRDGALMKIHRKDVPAEIAPLKGDRGLFLRLNFYWALEAGEIVGNPRFAKGKERADLRNGRIQHQSRKLPVTDKYELPVTDKYNLTCDRQVDTKGDTTLTPKEGYEIEGLGSRVSSSTDKPLSVPITDHDGWAVIDKVAPDLDHVIREQMFRRLMAGNLRPSFIAARLSHHLQQREAS